MFVGAAVRRRRRIVFAMKCGRYQWLRERDEPRDKNPTGSPFCHRKRGTTVRRCVARNVGNAAPRSTSTFEGVNHTVVRATSVEPPISFSVET